MARDNIRRRQTAFRGGATVRYLFVWGPKRRETGQKPGKQVPREWSQVIAEVAFASGLKNPLAMCKLAKLAFVAGAELPKRYVVMGTVSVTAFSGDVGVDK